MSQEDNESPRKQYEKQILAYLKKVADGDLDDLLWVVKQYAFKAMNETAKEEG